MRLTYALLSGNVDEKVVTRYNGKEQTNLHINIPKPIVYCGKLTRKVEATMHIQDGIIRVFQKFFFIYFAYYKELCM